MKGRLESGWGTGSGPGLGLSKQFRIIVWKERPRRKKLSKWLPLGVCQADPPLLAATGSMVVLFGAASWCWEGHRRGLQAVAGSLATVGRD